MRRKQPNHLGQWLCTRCQTWKEEWDFYYDKTHKRPVSWCKACMRVYARYHSAYAKKRRAEEREAQALEDLRNYVVERWGPPPPPIESELTAEERRELYGRSPTPNQEP